mmetsp:Transcript_20114/g.43348  ORF Transcript_20114/g.43348 Transcript_20114/m.43348 type:complete len:116 (+) Transcript_20114:1823-2170(+)
MEELLGVVLLSVSVDGEFFFVLVFFGSDEDGSARVEKWHEWTNKEDENDAETNDGECGSYGRRRRLATGGGSSALVDDDGRRRTEGRRGGDSSPPWIPRRATAVREHILPNRIRR